MASDPNAPLVRELVSRAARQWQYALERSTGLAIPAGVSGAGVALEYASEVFRDDDVTDYTPKNMAEARRMIIALRAERDEARKVMHLREGQRDALADKASKGDRYLAALREVLGLFQVVDREAGWAKSVYVSLFDLNGWLDLARQPRSEEDAA